MTYTAQAQTSMTSHLLTSCCGGPAVFKWNTQKKNIAWHYSPVGYPCLLDMLPNFAASFRYSNRHWSDKQLRMRPRLHFGSDLAMGSGWMRLSYGKNEKNGKICL